MEDLSKEPQVERELILVKLSANPSSRAEVKHSFPNPFFDMVVIICTNGVIDKISVNTSNEDPRNLKTTFSLK